MTELRLSEFVKEALSQLFFTLDDRDQILAKERKCLILNDPMFQYWYWANVKWKIQGNELPSYCTAQFIVAICKIT